MKKSWVLIIDMISQQFIFLHIDTKISIFSRKNKAEPIMK